MSDDDDDEERLDEQIPHANTRKEHELKFGA